MSRIGEQKGVASVMLSLAARMVMAGVASLTMTMFIAVIGNWALQQSGHSAPLSVLFWILFPATFVLSSTSLEYLEDGNIVRALKVSLFYTGLAAVLIIVLYYAAVVVSPRPRLARYHQRPSPEIAALSRPMYQVWKNKAA